MAACFSVARTTLWSQTPVDVEVMQALAGQFFKIAVEHEESFVSDGQDPNLIVLAVRYLGGVHAIPPMRDNTHWFFAMLSGRSGRARAGQHSTGGGDRPVLPCDRSFGRWASG